MFPEWFVSHRYPFRSNHNRDAQLCQLLHNPKGLETPYAAVQIALLSKYGDTTSLRFFFDSGADLMVIPIYVARREGIAYSTKHAGTLASSMGGTVTCWYDFVRVQSTLSG